MVIVVTIISFLYVNLLNLFGFNIIRNLIISQFLNFFFELLVLPKVQLLILLRIQSLQSFIFDLNQILVCLPIKKIDVRKNLLKSDGFTIKILLNNRDLLIILNILMAVNKFSGIFILACKSVCLIN